MTSLVASKPLANAPDHSLKKGILMSEWIQCVLVYLACTCLFYFPTFPQFSTALIGPPEDNMQFHWFLWYGSEALRSQNWDWMHTQMIYFPEGARMQYANYFYPGVVLAALLMDVVNLITLFNGLILMSFVLSGLSAYALIRYVSGHHVASLVGGFLYAFNPSHVAHAEHHITITSIQFLPLILLFTLKSFKGIGLRYPVLAGLSLALSAWCDWNYLVMGAMLVVLCYGYRVLQEKKLVVSHEVRQVLVIAIISFLCLAPLLIPMVILGMQSSVMRELPGHNIFVADLLGFVLPHPEHALGSLPWLKSVNQSMTGTAWEKVVYLGWANIVLLVLGFGMLWKKQRAYVVGLFVFLLLSLGVEVHVAGTLTGIPLPYAILQHIPFVEHARSPSRFIVFAYLCLGVLVACVLKEIVFKTKLNALKRVGVLVLLGVMFMDFFTPTRAMTPVVLPALYDSIIQDDDKDFAIFDLPWDGGRYMMYQTLHGIPNVQGYLGRMFDQTLIGKIPYDTQYLPIQKRLLTENKVKYIILHKKRLVTDMTKATDIKYMIGVRRIIEAYRKVYPVVNEDEWGTVFKVY